MKYSTQKNPVFIYKYRIFIIRISHIKNIFHLDKT